MNAYCASGMAIADVSGKRLDAMYKTGCAVNFPVAEFE